jgi:hypothetical protein
VTLVHFFAEWRFWEREQIEERRKEHDQRLYGKQKDAIMAGAMAKLGAVGAAGTGVIVHMWQMFARKRRVRNMNYEHAEKEVLHEVAVDGRELIGFLWRSWQQDVISITRQRNTNRYLRKADAIRKAIAKAIFGDQTSAVSHCFFAWKLHTTSTSLLLAAQAEKAAVDAENGLLVSKMAYVTANSRTTSRRGNEKKAIVKVIDAKWNMELDHLVELTLKLWWVITVTQARLDEEINRLSHSLRGQRCMVARYLQEHTYNRQQDDTRQLFLYAWRAAALSGPSAGRTGLPGLPQHRDEAEKETKRLRDENADFKRKQHEANDQIRALKEENDRVRSNAPAGKQAQSPGLGMTDKDQEIRKLREEHEAMKVNLKEENDQLTRALLELGRHNADLTKRAAIGMAADLRRRGRSRDVSVEPADDDEVIEEYGHTGFSELDDSETPSRSASPQPKGRAGGWAQRGSPRSGRGVHLTGVAGLAGGKVSPGGRATPTTPPEPAPEPGELVSKLTKENALLQGRLQQGGQQLAESENWMDAMTHLVEDLRRENEQLHQRSLSPRQETGNIRSPASRGRKEGTKESALDAYTGTRNLVGTTR